MAELAEPVTAGGGDGEDPGGRRDLAGTVLADTLVREAIGLAAALAVLMLIDPHLRGWARQAYARLQRRRPDPAAAAADAAVAGLRADISSYEASKGGCGGCA